MNDKELKERKEFLVSIAKYFPDFNIEYGDDNFFKKDKICLISKVRIKHSNNIWYDIVIVSEYIININNTLEFSKIFKAFYNKCYEVLHLHIPDPDTDVPSPSQIEEKERIKQLNPYNTKNNE